MYFFTILSGVRLSPLGTAATSGLLYQPQMIDEVDCGAIGGMKIGRGNRSTWRKPARVPLCLSQIPHDLTRARTRDAAVGSQRPTSWVMPWPSYTMYMYVYVNNWSTWQISPSYLLWFISYLCQTEAKEYFRTAATLFISVLWRTA
jgi:hypothetical protein